MDSVILNEESLPFETQKEATAKVPIFFDIVREFNQHQVREIRVSENFSTGWFNNLLAPDFYFRDYLKCFDRDAGIIRGIIEKTLTPQIPENDKLILEKSKETQFFLNEEAEMKSLGNAFLLNSFGLSFISNKIWENKQIELRKDFFENENIKSTKVKVNNISTIFHWEECKKNIEEEWKESARKGKKLWEEKETYFPNLIFCGNSQKQIKNLSIGKSMYECLWNNLQALNRTVKLTSNYSDFKRNLDIEFSDDSDTTKHNPKLRRRREFKLDNGNKEFFGFHLKNFPGAFRLHFYPDFENKIVYIGYFGPHLPY